MVKLHARDRHGQSAAMVKRRRGRAERCILRVRAAGTRERGARASELRARTHTHTMGGEHGGGVGGGTHARAHYGGRDCAGWDEGGRNRYMQ